MEMTVSASTRAPRKSPSSRRAAERLDMTVESSSRSTPEVSQAGLCTAMLAAVLYLARASLALLSLYKLYGRKSTRHARVQREIHTLPSSFITATAWESFCCTTFGGGGQRKAGFVRRILEMRLRAMKSRLQSLHFSSLWVLQKANAALGPPTVSSTGLKSASMRACMTGSGWEGCMGRCICGGGCGWS
ncbi:hypothetical protein K503DRAFT_551002 [Rhizopogon vinicolor AM-OR11-026]|uniref:Uncharacterized protein n=1 Tax=Rhizopogon vinicolor AM-OR11-026 TaxID=1314800 RepID=A0A1B7N853_9AGAM|nr:hypothetical protein K503DRAFT_551002 [Rhizopogon vinicolor AM-OR11-026]